MEIVRQELLSPKQSVNAQNLKTRTALKFLKEILLIFLTAQTMTAMGL